MMAGTLLFPVSPDVQFPTVITADLQSAKKYTENKKASNQGF
jgi:hypothetical protein